MGSHDVRRPLAGSKNGWLKETAEELHNTLPNGQLALPGGHGYGHGANIAAPDRFTDEVLSFISDGD